MTTIRATVRDGRIEPAEPIDLPDGTPLHVEYMPISERIGVDESRWRDDAEALADWSAWLDTIEPVAFIEDKAFEEEFRRFNLEAVRKQMFGEQARSAASSTPRLPSYSSTTQVVTRREAPWLASPA